MPANKLFILSIIIAACFSASAQSKKITYGSNAAAGHYAAIRGFKMYYETYGAGEPLLFINPNGGSIKEFENQVAFFSKKYKVILADSRAQGKSVDLSDSLSYEMMADDFNALLDFLHINNAYVIGWSDGGINGLLLAMRHPDKVKKLAATGANLRPDTTALTPDVFRDILSYERALLDTMRKVGPRPDFKNAYKVNHMMLIHPHIKPEQLHKIAIPVLIIGGDREAIPVKHAVEIAENIPNSNLWIIPNSGHSTPIYKKDQFNVTVAEFFSKPYKKREGTDRYY